MKLHKQIEAGGSHMREETLYDKLQEYSKSDNYPFHMPGHKRRMEKLSDIYPYALDITEINGFDNLHDAQDILKESMDKIAEFRGADQSFMLVNGSTAGLLAAISACVSRRDDILVARNCHKAVYNAIYMNELYPQYIYPQFSHKLGINGGISYKEIEKMLITFRKNPVVVLTSPTYEGVVSDIDSIAKLIHKQGGVLIVDQAHGAHFGMGEQFPKSALELGADLVIESVHKTLPAPTQTALLHVKGNRVNCQKLKKFLSIYQTTSPSYPMMAAISWCMDYCKKESRKEFVKYEERLRRIRRRISRLDMIELFDITEEKDRLAAEDYDFGKLVFGVKDGLYSGAELYDRLREKYHLEMEMAAGKYVIAMTSVMDTEEGLQRLFHALEEINDLAAFAKHRSEKEKQKKSQKSVSWKPIQNAMVYSPYEAECMEVESVELSQANDKVAADYVYLYPPGIPLIVPGEKWGKELVSYVKDCMEQGLLVKGVKDGKVFVVSK